MKKIALVLTACINAFSVTTQRAYVANQGSDNVTVIDLTNNSVLATISVGTAPQFLASTPNGNTVYVTCSGSANVYVIDNTLTPPALKTGANYPISVGNTPLEIQVTTDGTKAFLCNQMDATVSVINTDASSGTLDTIIGTLTTGANPQFLEVSHDGSRVFVGSRTSNAVAVI